MQFSSAYENLQDYDKTYVVQLYFIYMKSYSQPAALSKEAFASKNHMT